MKIHDDQPNDPDELAGLESAIAELRTLDAVPSAWRTTLSTSIREQSRGAPSHNAGGAANMRSPSRGVLMHPMLAIAAGICCAVFGSLTTWVILARSTPRDGSQLSVSPLALREVVARPQTSESIAVQFAVVARHAQRVSLVGDFNGWNAARTPLTLTRDGMTWSALVPLSRGRHTYAFVIDGDVIADPTAPSSADDDFGVPNSLVLVGSLR